MKNLGLKRVLYLLIAFSVIAINFSLPASPVAADTWPIDRTTRVSVATGGAQALGGISQYASISSTGRWVAFSSDANNLVPNDTNNSTDVFWRDMSTGQTKLVSISLAGGVGNGRSDHPSISADGRFVAFDSNAENLVSSRFSNTPYTDVFVRDMQNNKTYICSFNKDGFSALIGYSQYPAISADGLYVVYYSDAENLVATDANNKSDVFVYSLEYNTNMLISVASNGTQGNADSTAQNPPTRPAISANGRYVAFESLATNLTSPATTVSRWNVYWHDRDVDGNGVFDETGGIDTRLVSRNQANTGDGNQWSTVPSISGDGHEVVFSSRATDLVAQTDANGTDPDVFLRNILTDQTILVSVNTAGVQGNSQSIIPVISANGRYVAFRSASDNLSEAGDPDTNAQMDIFVRDLEPTIHTTKRVSKTSTGGQTVTSSDYPSISGDGQFIGFDSADTTIVPSDTNNKRDVFLAPTYINTVGMWRLNIDLIGAGSGTVSDVPHGISCVSSCVYWINNGTTITLTEDPNPDSVFNSWSGDCTAEPCSLVMTADKSVYATFDRHLFLPLILR